MSFLITKQPVWWIEGTFLAEIIISWFLSCSISEISLTVAEEGRPSKDSENAHQIEKCDCPVGYSGLSCEVGAPISVWQSCVCVTTAQNYTTEFQLNQNNFNFYQHSEASISQTCKMAKCTKSTDSTKNTWNKSALVLCEAQNDVEEFVTSGQRAITLK